jgi:hypothetical protein
MSDMDERRNRFSFAETYFFLKLMSGLFMSGLSVIFVSDLIVGKGEKPFWLVGLESIYGAIFQIFGIILVLAFPNAGHRAEAPDPNCVIEVVQFKGERPTVPWTITTAGSYSVNDLNVLPQQVPTETVTWQEVEIKTGDAKGALAWVRKADFDARRGRPGCG